MKNRGVYTIQTICILLIVCWYCTNDISDSYSVMHFDLSTPTVVSSVSHCSVYSCGLGHKNITETPIKKKYRRTRILNASPFVVPRITLSEARYEFPILFCKYELPIPENYNYLFYKEINPPPPKSC
jgi:hypothetical protein